MCDSFNGISGGDAYTYSTLPIAGFDATVVDTQAGFDFPFKPFFSGSGILVDETTNPGAITITYTGAPGAPYTYSTEVAGDATVVGTQVGTNFGFKPINGGTNINVTEVLGAVQVDGPTYGSDPVPGSSADITSTQVGNEFRFKPLNAGTGIDIDETTLPGAITISSIAPPPIQLFKNNTLFVDQQYGSNITGVRERRDLPYQTVIAAYNAALTGDTIHVFPGNYTESISVSTPGLKFYLENGVTINSSNTPIFTLLDNTQDFSVDGYGILSSTLVNGGIITVNNSTRRVVLKASGMIISNAATAFRLNSCSIDIQIPFISSSNTSTLFNINNCPNVNLLSNEIIWLGTLYSITSNTVTRLLINSNQINNTASSPSCISNCDNLNVEIRANDMLLQGPNLITINDTSSSITLRSNVDVHFIGNTISMVNGPLVTISSSKTVSTSYPRFHLTSNDFTISTLANNTLLNSINGDIYINSNILVTGANNLSQFANMIGTLYLTSKNFVYGPVPNTQLINATGLYINSDNFVWSGLITSSNGNIRCSSMIGSEQCSFSGNHNIITGELFMTNTSTTLLSVLGTTSIVAGNIGMTTGGSNIAISSAGKLQIKANELIIQFSSPHVTINISSLDNYIDVGLLSNSNISVASNGRLHLSVKNMVNDIQTNTGSIISVSGTLIASIDRIDIAYSRTPFRSIGTSSVFNLISGIINYGDPTPFNSICFDSQNGGIFNVSARSINYSAGPNSTLVYNSSPSTESSYRINKLLATGSTYVFTLDGASNTVINIDSAIVDFSLINMNTTGRTIINSNTLGTSAASNPLISIATSGTSMIFGSYATFAPNVISITTSAFVSLNSVRLISLGPCVTSVPTSTLSTVASSARFPPVGVTVVPAGTLFVDPSL